MRRLLFALVVVATAGPALAQPEKAVSFSPRGPQAQFWALLRKPANPVGSLILLPGGDGRLDIVGKSVTYLKANHVVRTRARYAQQGFVTLLPDIATDFKIPMGGVVSGYRGTLAHAQDIGALVQYLRGLTGKPVIVMGTSRGSIAAANAVAKLTGPARPDAAVLTSAFLSPAVPGLTVRSVANDDPNLLAIPMIAVINPHDLCAFTPPTELQPFTAWYAANGLKLGSGGFSTNLTIDVDPCEARTPHGFWGADDFVPLNLSIQMKKMIANLP